MARPGVTYSEVAEAASQLMGQGRNPTIEQVRLLIGSGSSTTIANHMKEWKEHQSGTSLIAAKENLPPELIAIVKGLWDRVMDQSVEKVRSIESEFEQTIAELQQELQKYKINNKRWQQLFTQWSKDKEKLTADKLSLELTNERLKEAHSIFQTKQETLQEQVDNKQIRIDELHRLHKQAQQNLEHFRESSREQQLLNEDRYMQLMQKKDLTIVQLQNELIVSKQDNLNHHKEMNIVIHEKELQQKTYDGMLARFDKLEQAFTKLEKDHSENCSALKTSRQQSEIWQQKSHEQSKILAELQQQEALLRQQLESLNLESKELRIQNKLLATEKWELAQEKAQVEGQLKQMQKMISTKEVA